MSDYRADRNVPRCRAPWCFALALLTGFAGCGDAADDIVGNGGDEADAPPNASPAAGMDQDVQRGARITLDGRQSTDPEDDRLSYTWTQLHGPDVTDGAGTLTGVAPVVDAPDRVSTLVFELAVDDGNGTGMSRDTVQINVMERTEGAIFVERQCFICHSVNSMDVISPTNIGPDLSNAVEDVRSRFGRELQDFLLEPTGTMAVVLEKQIILTREQRLELVKKLERAYELYLEKKAEEKQE